MGRMRLYEMLNNINIKFTFDTKINREFLFMHVLLQRNESGFLNRSVCRLKNWSGQYLHFQTLRLSTPLISKSNALTTRPCRQCLWGTYITPPHIQGSSSTLDVFDTTGPLSFTLSLFRADLFVDASHRNNHYKRPREIRPLSLL